LKFLVVYKGEINLLEINDLKLYI